MKKYLRYAKRRVYSRRGNTAIALTVLTAVCILLKLFAPTAQTAMEKVRARFLQTSLSESVVHARLHDLPQNTDSAAIPLLKLSSPAFLSYNAPEQPNAADTPAAPDIPSNNKEDISTTQEPSADEQATVNENSAVETTITGSGGGYQPVAEGIYIKNKTDYDIDVAALLNAPLTLDTDGTVLIIHTHGSEAYTPEGDDVYEPSDPSRTEDKNYNVIRVGDELERVLTERGVTVLHDREIYDYPSYTGSYTKTYEAICAHLAEHPEISVIIDLHRDALESADGTVYKTVADVGDDPCSQVMLIAGTDSSGLEHPNWRENLTFALHLQASMVEQYPSLARPLNISEYRYNQHATTGSLIVEVGCNGNTLREALNAVTYFGGCLADVLGK